MNRKFILPLGCLVATLVSYAQTIEVTSTGVGIGTASPAHSLDINGDAHVGGAFRIGELYFSPLQIIWLATGTERWVKLATIPNNHSVRFQLRSGSSNSEEIAEVKVLGTYHNDRTVITVERQTYYEHLREVRVTGSFGAPRTVYVKIRASDYAPSIAWRALDSKGPITLHNVEETPSGGLGHVVAGDKVLSTNANIVTTGDVGIGTTSPTARLSVYSTDPQEPSFSIGRNYDGSRIQFQYGSDTTTAGEIGMTYFGSGSMALWVGANLNSVGSSHASSPVQAVSTTPSWLQVFDTGNDNFDLRRIAAGGSSTTMLRVASNGYVGIGTTSPSYKLHVNGSVRASSFISDTTTYADFVFKPGYKLAPLSEVEAAIQKNGHLPGIPSEAEAKAHGVDLAAMQVKLLQKVEELTLHLIALDKEQRRLAEENTALQRKLSNLSQP